MRLVPMAQRNYNLVELGPRGTGKSYVYRDLSPYAILISGGRTTVANLFYNMSTRRVGLVGMWDVVAFDEVAGMLSELLEGWQGIAAHRQPKTELPHSYGKVAVSSKGIAI